MSVTHPPTAGLAAIMPCNDLDVSEAFYNRLGFARPHEGEGSRDDDYRILIDAGGGSLHLTRCVEGWLVPGRNPFGLYLRTDRVDALAVEFGSATLERSGAPEHKPWGMYEFAISDPDQTLVRIGWPSHLVRSA